MALRFPRLPRRVVAGLAPVAGSVVAIAVAVPLAAQDYVDVEAERARAAAARPARSASVAPAVSYGLGNAPAAATALPSSMPPPITGGVPGGDSTGVLFNQVQQLQQEVMRLNGVVEQLSYEVRQLREQSLERYLDIDRRLAGGVAAPAGTAPVAGSGSASAALGGGPDATAVKVAEQPGEGEAYRAAYALVRGQEFDQAVSAFDSFLRRFPDGRYAPNAHYWLGELYLVLDPPDPEAARQAFMLLLDQYPDNPKVPDALYKLGRVHFIKGNNARSREFLERVMRDYPDSSAARLAGDFIDQNL